MRKTGRKWKTKKCGRCGGSHSGYSGKLDGHGVEYVVCQLTNKRMNIPKSESNFKVVCDRTNNTESNLNNNILNIDIRDVVFPTKWVEEEVRNN